MFSRGWALTTAYGVELPATVREPEARALSLWTLFTADTYGRIRDAMAAGEFE